MVVFLTFLLFFLPLLVVPLGSSYFEVPKVIAAEIVIEILLLLVLFRKAKFFLNNFNYQYLVLFTLIFFLTVIHLIFLRTNTTFFGNTFRLQGIFLLWHLLLFSLISIKVSLDKVPSWVYLLSLGGLLVGGLVLGGNELSRVVGTLGEPNALAGTVTFIWPFIYFRYSKWYLKYASFIPVITLILLSNSRSGFIAFFIQILFILLLKIKFTLSKATLVCLILIGITGVLPFLEGGGVYENRGEIWSSAFIAGLQNPIFGGGFGNIEKVIPQGSEILKNNARFQYVDSAHNILLDFWVEGGIIGLGILLFLIYKTFDSFIKKSRMLETICLLGLLTVMFFNPVSVVNLIHFWWLLGQGWKTQE